MAKTDEKTEGNYKPKPLEKWEPFILGIFCNWCTYAGADQAGTSRMQRPANLRVMRVMCSGRVEPQWVMEALKQGADGVLISGCHIGDCHYVEGNFKTARRMPLLIKMLEQLGIHKDRVKFQFVSASEGAELTEIVDEFVADLKKIGPGPFNKKFKK
ncbi:MAG: hydrogenase iron-sulfur subunit [Candidatus Lokiarchaeota archaeon]|nr:hydrogenase iron-sulfur subunit [Candidatus Lokiarchaeota archaeon]